ncbi:MAG: exodeoxyribonuclease VII large subunit [Planctomycetota bacterium]|nr:exodeoxyribonuclease VII large subunit [Planctomycetota bacterium]
MTRMLWDDDEEDDQEDVSSNASKLEVQADKASSQKSTAASSSGEGSASVSGSRSPARAKSSKSKVAKKRVVKEDKKSTDKNDLEKSVVEKSVLEKLPDEPGTTSESPLSIEDLNQWIAAAIEANIPKVWVAGEITDLSQPRSGHIYMGLKDANAQIRAVLWRSSAERLKFKLEDGQAVLAYGRVDLYSPRGSYQLVIERIEPQGVGALQLAFQQLYQRLAKEGLFDADRKKPLVRFPKRIGFVTSPSGAAIKDFLEVLRRRWRGTDVIIIPAKVQGVGAAEEIVAGIQIAQRIVPPLDCLVVGRGGGSMEDLWCFNEEVVVRAIAASKIQTISAVGHEIDVTLSDLVADVRALTPSEAAELVVPSEVDVLTIVEGYERRLTQSLQQKFDLYRLRLDSIARRPVVTRPEEYIAQRAQRIDELSIRIERAIDRTLEAMRLKLASSAASLDALSPLKTLERGYSLTRLVASKVDSQGVGDADASFLLTSSSQVAVGDTLETRLDKGLIESLVTRIVE